MTQIFPIIKVPVWMVKGVSGGRIKLVEEGGSKEIDFEFAVVPLNGASWASLRPGDKIKIEPTKAVGAKAIAYLRGEQYQDVHFFWRYLVEAKVLELAPREKPEEKKATAGAA